MYVRHAKVIGELIPETPEAEEELGVAAHRVTAGIHVVMNDGLGPFLFSRET